MPYALEQCHAVLPLVGMNNVEEGKLRYFLLRVSEALAPGAVYITKAAFRGDALDQITGVVQEISQVALAFSQRVFSLLPFAYIPDGTDYLRLPFGFKSIWGDIRREITSVLSRTTKVADSGHRSRVWMLIGYCEGLDSERGMAWRAADSLGLRRFLRMRR